MSKKTLDLIRLFKEDFTSDCGGLPGSWYVEQESDMAHVPAIECGENCINFLSAGNKFLPVIPDTKDAQVDFTFSVNYDAADRFGFMISFRYDSFTRKGQYIRLSNALQSDEVVIEYGNTSLNYYKGEKSFTFKPDKKDFFKPMDISLSITGKTAEITALGKKFKFTVKEGEGKIAFAREHFWDVLKLTSFSILGNEPQTKTKDTSFTVMLPDSLTHYPVYCDVVLKDYGNCMDAALSFHGGVSETPIGEGNYHGKRADMMTNPYLKVLTEESSQKFIVCKDTIVMVPPGNAAKFFYGIIYHKYEWPFKRNVRFMKPQGKFDLAVGFENWHHTVSPNEELNPAETVFTTKGKLLYSGLGISDGENTLVEFLSQEDKEIVKRIPKNDLRYEKAVNFAKKNHYFFEKEKMEFSIRITSLKALPEIFEVNLLDAFLRPLEALDFDVISRKIKNGVKYYDEREIVVKPLKKLACGVYHISITSLDPSAEKLYDYAAFEVMSREKDALPPPLISGLPFLYNARTETRGLLTDSFDPWMNVCADEGHYTACTVMLPENFSRYKMAPTLKAYGRENFSWIGTRTLDKPDWRDHLDVVKDSKYVNVGEHPYSGNLTWNWMYIGNRLKIVIDFLKKIKKTPIDIANLEKVYEKGECLPHSDFLLLAKNHWEDFQDYFNDVNLEMTGELLAELRKVNPKVKFATYGPYAVYGSALKSGESVRMNGSLKIPPEMVAFWQYEDYPLSCGYSLDYGLFFLTGALLYMPGAHIYPEVYGGSKLRNGCPDGAVFYAFPPFGCGRGPVKERSEKFLTRQIANFCFGTGHLTDNGFEFWSRRGFQAMRFTRRWFEAVLRIWPLVLEQTPVRPLRSAAYVLSRDSRRANNEISIKNDFDIRQTATEGVPFIYLCAASAGVCAGFQLKDENMDQLSAGQVDTLVLPPTKGMSKKVIAKIRKLHEEGVNLIACQRVDGLEDIFGVKDTGKKRRITKVTGTKGFFAELSDYCDDEECTGSYKADGAEVLLKAEIPVLTLKKNKKASAAFFNVPPNKVHENGLRQRVYGNSSISVLMEKATSELMKQFAASGISITSGRLLGCHTKDGGILAIVMNPSDEKDLVTSITVEKKGLFAKDPEVNTDVTIIEETEKSRTFRVHLDKGDYLTLFFK
ncbi:MAG: hypothetical protein J6S53_06695 [Lentisphaeria bacterium]|nr:hypothetical protein [Lentisphaeria bacterium]